MTCHLLYTSTKLERGGDRMKHSPREVRCDCSQVCVGPHEVEGTLGWRGVHVKRLLHSIFKVGDLQLELLHYSSALLETGGRPSQ